MTLNSTMKSNLSGPSASSLRGAGGFGETTMQKSSGKRSKTGLNTSRSLAVSAYSWLLLAVVMIITMSSLIQPLHANPTCILNCAQCVKIYGDFFDGHSCAKVCLESRTRFDSFVDCADPTTIARFLKSY